MNPRRVRGLGSAYARRRWTRRSPRIHAGATLRYAPHRYTSFRGGSPQARPPSLRCEAPRFARVPSLRSVRASPRHSVPPFKPGCPAAALWGRGSFAPHRAPRPGGRSPLSLRARRPPPTPAAGAAGGLRAGRPSPRPSPVPRRSTAFRFLTAPLRSAIRRLPPAVRRCACFCLLLFAGFDIINCWLASSKKTGELNGKNHA